MSVLGLGFSGSELVSVLGLEFMEIGLELGLESGYG